MTLTVAIILAVITCVFSSEENTAIKRNSLMRVDPEVDMKALEIIRYYGYEGEEHEVVTEDGYILQIQRLPCSRNESLSGRCNQEVIRDKPVIMLQHGLLACSTDWLLNTPTDSHAFILADAGFDVWLGNVRGNTYGRQHVRLSPKHKEFWEFTFDQMAQFDFPNMVDYILGRTGRQKLFLIGHSQGTIVPFAAFSLYPELQEKVDTFMALGPVTTVGHISGLFSWIAPISKSLTTFLMFFGQKEFLPSNWIIKKAAKYLCYTPLEEIACENFFFLLMGFDAQEMNKTRLPVYISHDPAGTSTLNLAHWGQMVNSGKFQMFDYGRRDNMRVYNQKTPPLYNLDNVHVKTYLFYGGEDWLADPTDVEGNLLDRPFVKDFYKYDTYNHLDFLWAINVKEYVIDVIVKLLKQEMQG